MDLKEEERRLLRSLVESEAEAQSLRFDLSVAEGRVEAIKRDLNGIREQVLDAFLSEHLTPLYLTYLIKHSEGEILLDVDPLPGGELEFEKFKSSIKWTDLDNVPVFYVLDYLQKGSPFEPTETYIYR